MMMNEGGVLEKPVPGVRTSPLDREIKRKSKSTKIKQELKRALLLGSIIASRTRVRLNGLALVTVDF